MMLGNILDGFEAKLAGQDHGDVLFGNDSRFLEDLSQPFATDGLLNQRSIEILLADDALFQQDFAKSFPFVHKDPCLVDSHDTCRTT